MSRRPSTPQMPRAPTPMQHPLRYRRRRTSVPPISIGVLITQFVRLPAIVQLIPRGRQLGTRSGSSESAEDASKRQMLRTPSTGSRPVNVNVFYDLKMLDLSAVSRQSSHRIVDSPHLRRLLSATVALADLVGSATLVAVMVTICAEEIVAGAVYKPAVIRVPTDGFMLQVTAVLPVPLTVAVNCCWPLAVRVTDTGVTDTATVGVSATVALADLVGSATLVAVMVTVCAEEIVAGAVYNPPVVRVPTDGFILQVTAVLLVPLTVAVNCCWPLAVRVTDTGVTDTATVGVSATVALADLVGSATLVAVMVTVCAEEIVAGAVYNPPVVRVPTDGFILQVTAVLLVPLTVAVNCCWPLAVRVTDTGVTDTATVGVSATVALA